MHPKPGRAAEAALLSKYHGKRHFDATPEPTGSVHVVPGGARFVVQKHHASRLHYDFRLEADGVLKSWAVPKGPTLDPKERRLAMQVEDHPLDYFDFEGVIPAGNYGAGEVIVWDWGTYEPLEGGDAGGAIAKGKLTFRMQGEKLRGVFTLVKMHGRGGSKDNAWLLIKDKDTGADSAWSADQHAESVKSGRPIEKLKDAGPDEARWISNRTAKATRAAGRPTKPRTKSGGAEFPGKAESAVVAKKTRSKKRGEPLPRVLELEKATLLDAPFDDPDWLFEIKWDGFRALLTVHENGHVDLVSRNGKDLLGRFPQLAKIGERFTGTPAMIDGEIVVLDANGKSSFQRLQNFQGAPRSQVTFVAFDALYAEGHDLRAKPLDERKAVLARILKSGSSDVLFSEHVVERGRALFASAQKEGLEGIVGKKRDSVYLGKRTRDWVKIKAQLEQECVIAGWTEPSGSRAAFGSLVLGLYERGRFVYCGNVGTGFDAATLRAVAKKLEPLATSESPFASTAKIKMRRRVHWARPELVAQVRFTEWTEDGAMRHPTFLGLRDDKSPRDCHRELPEARVA
ncbi:MAG: non-homologous end-joining DNA ligase [Myxococcota bacterium]|nr:non-homologous end-joining DNA ligase [Myxococcota bacterium]